MKRQVRAVWALLALVTSQALAQTTYYYDNVAGAGFGTAGGNWAVPTSGPNPGWNTDGTGAASPGSVTTLTIDSLNFGNGATGLGGGTITISGTVDAGNMTFASGSGAITLSGGTSINLAAASTITVNNAADTISAVLAGGGTSVTKAGTGTLTLSGANTYTGGTVLNAGTLSLGTATTLGNTTNLTFAGNATVNMNDQNVTVTQTVINAGAMATFYKGGGGGHATLTFGGPITGSGTFNFYTTGGGGSVTFTGGLATFSGVLQYTNSANSGGAFNVPSLADVAANIRQAGPSGLTFTYTGSTPLVLNNRQFELATTGSLSLNNNAVSAANTLAINNDLLVTAAGAKTLSLGGNNPGINTFAGRINDGTGAVISLAINTGGAWSLPATNTFTGAVTINSGTVIVSSLKDYGVASSLGAAASGAIIWDGPSSVTISYTGTGDSCNRSFRHNTQIAGGTPYSTILNNGTGPLTFTAPAFIAAPFASGNGSGRGLALGGTYSGGTNEIQGTIKDMVFVGATPNPTPFTKHGPSSWMLSGSNTFTGGTTLSNGVLILNYATQDNSKLSDTAALTLCGGTLTLKGATGSHIEVVASTSPSAGGTFLNRDGANTAKLRLNAITRAAGGTISFADATIADTDTLNVNGILGGWATLGDDWAMSAGSGTDIAITALVSYAGALPSTGAGAAASNYTLAGNQLQTSTVAANTVKITGAGGDTLDLAGNTLTITSTSATAVGGILYTGSGTYNIIGTTAGSGINASGAFDLIINTGAGNLNISAEINGSNGARNLVKTGAGTLVVSSANAYTGITYANQGVLRLAHANGAGTTGGINVQNGAALELTNSVAIGVKALSISGTGVSGGGALRNLSGDNSYGGVITIGAGGARINSDSGTLTLSNGIGTALFQDVTFGGSGNTTASGVISGAGRVIKDGSGTLTFSGAIANTYTGETVVNSGKLMISSTAGAIADSAVLRVASGAKVELGIGMNELVGFLYLDGQPAALGTWGSYTSGATYKDAHFRGDGTVTVSQVGPGTPYVALGPSGTLFIFR